MENISGLAKLMVPVEWLFSVLPEGASSYAEGIDYLFWFLIITTGILFLLVVVPMFLIIVKYRRRTPDQRAVSQKDHNFWLESLWTFLPFIYLGILFVWGFYQYMNMFIAPNDAMELRVIGQKWQWSVDYPKHDINIGGQGGEIVIPVGMPVKLIMSSQDVIHSFYIPNMRIKQDVVPGRYSTLWFEATKEGRYPVECAEYCGNEHSGMISVIVAVAPNEFAQWVEKQKSADQALPLPELGKKLYTKLGCNMCHSIDGSIKLAPSFKGVYGKMEELTDGSKVKIDDNYIKQSILFPQKQVAKGYPPIMPSFQGRVSERDILGLTEFIKSLSS